MLRSALLVTASLLGGLLTTATPAHASIDTTWGLPRHRVTDLVVDDAHGHVFVTGADGYDDILVRSLGGAPVTTIPNQPGAAGMALSPDGTTLWVALSQGNAISAIDTTTLTETARYPLAEGLSALIPQRVGVIGTSVWFSYVGGASGPDLGVVDLSGTEPEVLIDRSGADNLYGEFLVVPPGRTDRIVVADAANVRSLTVDGTSLTVGAAAPLEHWVESLAVSTDGSRVLSASTGDTAFPIRLGDTLAPDGTLPKQNGYANSVAISSSGYFAVGADAYNGRDIRVFAPDRTLVREYEFGDYTIQPDGLRFSPDGATLYAVTNYPNGTTALRVLHDPAKLASSISLTKPATARVGTAFTLNGKLIAAAPVAAGTPIHVYRTSAKYGTATLPDVVTTSTGTFSFTDTVQRRGPFTYTAHWDGDETRGASGTSVTVDVAGLVPSITVTTNASTYTYLQTAYVTAHLGKTFTNRALTLAITPYGGRPTTLRSGNVDANGNHNSSAVPRIRSTFSATFAGGDVYAPRKVTREVLVRPLLTSSLAGYYGTSGSYRLYRRTADPLLTIRARPLRRGCIRFVGQRYYSGAWRTFSVLPCGSIDAYSYARAALIGDPVVGSPYRVRGSFIKSDTFATAVGAWQYLKFT